MDYGLWVIVMGHCELITFSNVPSGEDIGDRGAMHGRGAMGQWEISVPYFPFCCEPKTALKKVFEKYLG